MTRASAICGVYEPFSSRNNYVPMHYTQAKAQGGK